MSATTRRCLAVAAIAALAGSIFGFQLGGSGLELTPGLGIWIGIIGMGTLGVMFLSASATSSATAVAMDEAGWTEFRRELRRARRSSRPMTLLRIAGDELPAGGSDVTDNLVARGRLLGIHLRLVDRLWVDNGSIYVLLPESPRSAADVLITRIRAASPGQLPKHIHIATFPEDGLTGGAIIAAVNGASVDAIPTPIRPTLTDGIEVAAFALEQESSFGEAART